MLTPLYRNKFLKDLKRAEKRGKDLLKLKKVVKWVIEEKTLPKSLRDHALKGEYSDCRECHIEPDWLLIYFISEKKVTFIRIGSHSDLFR